MKPRVVLASADDLARMPRILEKAKENCFVSNSIKSAIKIELEVFHEQSPRISLIFVCGNGPLLT